MERFWIRVSNFRYKKRKEGRSLVGIPARAEERINYDKLLAMIGVFGECEITGRASTDKLVLMECRYVRDEAE